MAITKERKKEIINDLGKKAENQKVMIFTGFKGLKNKDLLELRKELKNNDSCLMVVKKTLIKLAFDEKKLNIDYGKLEGEAAIIFGFQDQVIPAKTVFNFSQKNPAIKIIGGMLDGEFKNESDIIELAKLPSMQEIRAKFVGTVQAPISGFINVLQGNIKGLVYILSNIKK